MVIGLRQRKTAIAQDHETTGHGIAPVGRRRIDCRMSSGVRLPSSYTCKLPSQSKAIDEKH